MSVNFIPNGIIPIVIIHKINNRLKIEKPERSPGQGMKYGASSSSSNPDVNSC